MNEKEDSEGVSGERGGGVQDVLSWVECCIFLKCFQIIKYKAGLLRISKNLRLC